jgi:hypothetical protein
MKLSCFFGHSRAGGDDNPAGFYFSFVINILCLRLQNWLSFIRNLIFSCRLQKNFELLPYRYQHDIARYAVASIK